MIRLLVHFLFGLGVFSNAGEYLHANLPLGPNGAMSSLHYFTFSDRDHVLKVIDQGLAAPRYASLESALRANGCVAGISGVDFGRNGKPPGLLIAGGRVRGEADAKDSGASATLYAEDGKIRLLRSAVFAAKAPPLPREVLQAGPFLIENGKPAAALGPPSFARRTVVATDGKGNWLLAYTPPTSRATLADVLLRPAALKDFKILNAIEVTVGSRAAMWCRLPAAPLYFREIDPLQSFLGVAEK